MTSAATQAIQKACYRSISFRDQNRSTSLSKASSSWNGDKQSIHGILLLLSQCLDGVRSSHEANRLHYVLQECLLSSSYRWLVSRNQTSSLRMPLERMFGVATRRQRLQDRAHYIKKERASQICGAKNLRQIGWAAKRVAWYLQLLLADFDIVFLRKSFGPKKRVFILLVYVLSGTPSAFSQILRFPPVELESESTMKAESIRKRML